MNYSSENELLIALKQGEKSAFIEIYTLYYNLLVNYADRLLNNLEVARDTVQQIYYKIWENRKKLDISISIKAYLFKSVYHACLNTMEHQKNIRKYEEQQLTDFYFSTIIQTPEVEMDLWQLDIQQALEEAIATLPEKCREVFVLSKMEGLKNREIAVKLNISEKTVERHMSIAIKKLRKELDWLLQLMVFFSTFHWG